MNHLEHSLLLEAVEENQGGVTAEERVFEGGKVTTVLLQENNPFGRPPGRYYTVELEQVDRLQDEALERAVREIGGLIIPLLRGNRILVAALGNNDITPDSLGPKMTAHLMITRPLIQLQPELFGEEGLRSVAAVCTNVYGATGVESAEMIAGICRQIGAQTVIVIDALSTSHLSRLCSTVQIADSGIAPGAGVGNFRQVLDQKTLGVPVISIGMPTVMNGRTLAEYLCENEKQICQVLSPFGEDLIVTPTRIGVATDNGAKLIAFALNHALHHEMSIPDMLKYLS